MTRREPWILAGAVLLAYLIAFQGAFQFDDFQVIVDNPAVHTWSAWAAGAWGIRPLLKASYALNWGMGPGPFGFHLVNLGIHLANVLLAWTLIRRLLARSGAPAGAALWAALLFALHPLQTEAVTYLSGRSVSLAACLSLASLVAYTHRETRVWRWGISPGLFVLACLVRETALVLPLALALWEWTAPEGEGRPWRGPWVHWGLLVLLGVGVGLHPVYRHLLGVSFGARDMGAQALSQVAALGYLLGRWLRPWFLNIDPRLAVPGGWTWALGLQALVLAAGLALGLVLRRRQPWLSFALLWAWVFVLPTNSFIPRLDVVNERQAYLASLGLAVAVAGLGAELAARWGRPSWTRLLAAALCAGLLGLTVARNRDYRSEAALWQSSLAANPRNPRAQNNLGCAHFFGGRPDLAEAAFQAALQLDPGYLPARRNLRRLAPPSPREAP